MSLKLHQTKDGSSTLYSSEFEQYYHNPNGAASESLFVFFEKSGLIDFLENAKSVTIFEIGFGTGLNFLLLLDILQEKQINIPVSFYTIEAFPIDYQIASSIDFTGHLSDPKLNNILPGIFTEISPGMNVIKPLKTMDVTLHLFAGNFEKFSLKDINTDFIFHDPFSPEVNKELWTESTFQKLAGFSKPETVLSTYCAASKARGAMCSAGWFVARTRGALGKREMTIASLSEEKLLDYKRVNESKLTQRYRNGDF
jgi:tRNA U34 5-methylaminomethyl-2-thiouridine-forming methyltransferase MnmC